MYFILTFILGSKCVVTQETGILFTVQLYAIIIPTERYAIFKSKYRVTPFRNISFVQDQKDLCINEYIQNSLYLKGTRTTMCLSEINEIVICSLFQSR